MMADKGPIVATSVPGGLLPIFLVSPIPLYLNIQIIRAYFKYDVLRRAPSDILTTLAVIYGLRDIFFIFMGIISIFFTQEGQSFNDSVCDVVGYSSYIILYLVYTYSSALNVFLGMAAGSSSLYTDESTKPYHYGALFVTAVLVLACFIWGTQYQTPVTICTYTLGSADGIVPSMFVISLLFFTYKIYRLRAKSKTSAFAARNKTFMDTFLIYVILSYAYTLERLIKYFVDDSGGAYTPFSNLSTSDQIFYYVEYIIASTLTYTIFIIRYYDDSTRKKLRILIGLEKDTDPFRGRKSTSDGSPTKRKKSEHRKSEEEMYSAEVKFTINMRKVILISMMNGVSWALDNAEEILENVPEAEIENLPKSLNRTEDYMIIYKDLIQDNPEAGELCKKLGVELDDARISFHNYLMLLREITSKVFDLQELKKSFNFRENHEYLDDGFEESDNTLCWVTHDSKYRIDIIDSNFSKSLINFWRELFDYQAIKSACIIQPIVLVGQYMSQTNPTNAHFIISRNKFIPDELVHIQESFCIKFTDFSSFQDKKRFLELKNYLKDKAYVKPDRVDIFEDVVFLQDHALLFSIVINVVKILGEERASYNQSHYIEVWLQNLTKVNTSIDVIRYTKNINNIFDFIYENGN